MTFASKTTFVLAASVALFVGCSSAQGDVDPVADHLTLFDKLDFEAYNKQDWALFRQLHCDDVIVTSSDGTRTDGIEAHLAAVKPVFSFAPDTTILRHPVAAGKGDWTAVTGVFRSTFSLPLQLPDGTTIPPTNKTLEAPVATIAKWRGNCVAEEQLFMPDSKVQSMQWGLGQ